MTDPRFERNDLPWFARRVVWLLGFTLVVRVGVLLLMPGALGGDPDGYRRLAENVVEYGTLGEGLRPTAYRPPLYPLLLAPCAALGSEAATAAIGGLHVLLGVGTVWLVWRIARRCGWGRWAWLAGALVACDPILLGQSALVMTETAATFFVTLALWALVRAAQWPSYCRLAAAGAALGLCGLCRPELLLWGGACAGSVLFLRDAKSKPSRDREGAVEASDGCNRSLTVAARFSSNAARFFVLLLAVLAPWVARNQIQFGRPIIATTHGGYTLLLANNPSFYDYLRHGGRGAIWDARELGPVWGGKASHDSPAAELAADRRAYAEAWNNIQKQPGMFAYACAARKGRFWALAPHQGTPTVRWAIGVWYLVE
ncbi:MAG TPA: glycosyltransferase family 39 protein, partial [Thermoguttaceae bacterium]|nr:glycosyltransferase family 39 protein [Thermoguttaceae bacterium]